MAAGNASLGSGQLAEAADQYRAAIQANSDALDAYIALGYVLKESGESVLAEQALLQALERAPGHADALYMLGGLALAQGAHGRAADYLTDALKHNPQLEPAYGDAALALFRAGRAQDALECLNEGFTRFPTNAQLVFALGNLLAETGDHARAVPLYRRFLQMLPGNAAALANLGNCERHLGQTKEATKHLQQALAQHPDNAGWHSNLLFTLQYTGELDASALFAEHRRYAERFEAPWRASWPNHGDAPRVPGERLRIGYVSGDFREHALAHFFEPVLRHHDRHNVELFAYYTYPVHDRITRRIAALFEHWRDCFTLGDEEMVARVRADRIDVLVDLSGHTGYNRLPVFARKPAPVQITWLGYQATTGLSAMDLRITDSGIDPPGLTEKHHSEQLLRLSTGALFQPDQESPEVGQLPVLTGSAFTFACLNNPAKITPAFLDLAARILQASPTARLMLGSATPETTDALAAQFSRRGVTAAQLVFVGRRSLSDYLQLHQQIDVALDTFPYNGGTTTLHSLWMGVPVLSLEGETSIGRVGALTMRALGLPQFACQSKEDYVARALELQENLPDLQQIRSGLRARMDAMFIAAGQGYVQEIEQHFIEARARVSQRAAENAPQP